MPLWRPVYLASLPEHIDSAEKACAVPSTQACQIYNKALPTRWAFPETGRKTSPLAWDHPVFTAAPSYHPLTHTEACAEHWAGFQALYVFPYLTITTAQWGRGFLLPIFQQRTPLIPETVAPEPALSTVATGKVWIMPPPQKKEKKAEANFIVYTKIQTKRNLTYY